MMDSILGMFPKGRKRGAIKAVAGMGSLLIGGKIVAGSLFVSGLAELETAWREAHPEFDGNLKERWALALAFYEATHTNPTNRLLHVIGIPLIVGGAVGLVLSPTFSPPWWASAGSFGTGWALNIAGHIVFEKNRPAFADDPLSFLAGPVWDIVQARNMLGWGVPAVTV